MAGSEKEKSAERRYVSGAYERSSHRRDPPA